MGNAFFAIVFQVLVLFAPFVWPLPCQTALTAFEGVAAVDDHPFKGDLAANYDIFRLGKGTMGGTVYRLSSKTGKPSRVIKVYEKKDSLENDVRAFAFLGPVKSQVVSLPWYKRLDPTWLELEDVGGQTLESIHFSKDMDAELRDKVYQDYLIYIREVEAHFDKKIEPRFLDVFLQGSQDEEWMAKISTPYKDKSGYLQTNFFLKMDNFVVEAKTFRLFLIDPY